MSTLDLDELLAQPERPGAQECNVCWALERLDPTTAEKMHAVLARRDIVGSRVRKAFGPRFDGWAPGESSIQRHRDGGCQS